MVAMRRELGRKAFHVASAFLPALVWVLPRRVSVTLLVAVALAAVAVDFARLQFRWARYQFLRRTRVLLRTHERHGFAGATYMVAAYAVALLVFPTPIAVAGMLYNGLGDASAALVGKRFGRHRTSWGKSWEGFFAALVVNLAIGFAVPGIPTTAAVAGALAGAILEFLPLPFDDNLRVTLGGAAALWLLSR